MIRNVFSYATDFFQSGFKLQALGKRVFFDMCQKIVDGEVEVLLPSGETHEFGKKGSKLYSKLTILNENFFGRLVTSGDIGFSEAFIEHEIEVSNLTALFKILIQSRDNLNDLDPSLTFFGNLLDTLTHWGKANTVTRAQQNISAHYDLSNEMFETFLDKTMCYSSGVFNNENETLEEAQYNKLRQIVTKAKLKPEHHLLDIGCGWGALAMEAVKMTGCRVTGLTLSKEQKELAEKRIADAGMSDKIEIKLCDYRLVEGKFDRIISIEMLEHVGHEFYGVYFKTCEKLLKPNGIAVIQVITMPENRYEAYLKGVDFIQKYIFPGGNLPSVNAMVAAMSKDTNLTLESLENIGPHYARTLRIWCENFEANSEKLVGMGFDMRFQRIWEYYLCYCEAGFASRTLGDVQMVVTRPNNLELSEGIPE